MTKRQTKTYPVSVQQRIKSILPTDFLKSKTETAEVQLNEADDILQEKSVEVKRGEDEIIYQEKRKLGALMAVESIVLRGDKEGGGGQDSPRPSEG